MRFAPGLCLALSCSAAPSYAAGARYRLSASYSNNGLEQVDGSDEPRRAVHLRADALHLLADGEIEQQPGWRWQIDLNALFSEQTAACDEAFKDDVWTRYRCRAPLVEQAFVSGPADAAVRWAAGRKHLNQGGFITRDRQDSPFRDSFYGTYHAPLRTQELVVEAQLHMAGQWSLQVFDDIVTNLEQGGQVSPKSMQPAGAFQWEYKPLPSGAEGLNPLAQVMLYDLLHSHAAVLGVEWRWGVASGWLNYIMDRRVQRLGNTWFVRRLDEQSAQFGVDVCPEVTVSWRHVRFEVHQPDAPDQYVSDRAANITKYFDDNGQLDTVGIEWRRSGGLIPGLGINERRGVHEEPNGATGIKRERAIELNLRGRL